MKLQAMILLSSYLSGGRLGSEPHFKLCPPAAVEAAETKHRAEREAAQALQGNERVAKLDETTQALNEDTYTALTDILKPEQIKRLKQVYLQRQGPKPPEQLETRSYH